MPDPIELGICSFSFHRRLAAGKQDIFQYIADCKSLGCTLLDPWNAHLSAVSGGSQVLEAANPRQAKLEATDDEYIDRVKTAADEAGLPFGCIAVDGTHIHADDPAAWDKQFAIATRWLDIAHKLGARSVRIDAGGPDAMTDDTLATTVEGFNKLIAYANDRGVEVLIENHWGPTPDPAQLERLLAAVDGLGLLFDSNNWRPEAREAGFDKLASRAKACHIKLGTNPDRAYSSEPMARDSVRRLYDAGFRGPWGVESVAHDDSVDEIAHAKRTIDLIQEELAAKEAAA